MGQYLTEAKIDDVRAYVAANIATLEDCTEINTAVILVNKIKAALELL